MLRRKLLMFLGALVGLLVVASVAAIWLLQGVLVSLDAMAVGVAAWRLGAGRSRKEDPVQAGAGVELHAKPGAAVSGGQPLFTLHTDEPERFEAALAALEGGFVIAPPGSRPADRPLVIDRVG